MNKFFSIVALFVCVAGIGSAFAEEDPFTQLAVVPSDDEETRYLPESNKIFSDYCISSRDTIKTFIKDSANSAAAEVFEAIFTSVNDLGTEVVSNTHTTIEKSAEIIKDNVVAKPDQAESENLTLIQLMASAAKTVLQALVETAQTQLFERIALLKGQFTSEGLKDKISATCNSISYNLKQKLESKLTETRNQMKVTAAKMGAEGASMVDSITKARYDNIGCLTVGRVVKVQKFCDILNVAGSSIYPLLGL